MKDLLDRTLESYNQLRLEILDRSLPPPFVFPAGTVLWWMAPTLLKRTVVWLRSLSRYWPVFMTRARYHQIGHYNLRLQGERDQTVQANTALQKRLDDILFLPSLRHRPGFAVRTWKDPRDHRLAVAVEFSGCLLDETLANGGYGKLVELIGLKVCDAMQAKAAPEGFGTSAYLKGLIA